MKKQFPLVLIIILFFVVVSSVIFTPVDSVVKEDSEYMYITQYSVYGLDSTTTKYHKSVQYEGKVVSKKIDKHFIGRLGHGGHWNTNTYITVEFNNRTYEEKYSNWGLVSNIKLNEGDCVTVIESFYPSHEIKIVEQ